MGVGPPAIKRYFYVNGYISRFKYVSYYFSIFILSPPSKYCLYFMCHKFVACRF